MAYFDGNFYYFGLKVLEYDFKSSYPLIGCLSVKVVGYMFVYIRFSVFGHFSLDFHFLFNSSEYDF